VAAAPAQRTSLQPLTLAAIPVLFLAAALVAPALRLGLEGAAAWSWQTVIALWQDDYLRWRVLWSLLQAGVSALLVLALGLPIAWVLARCQFAGRTLVLRLLMLPQVVPTLVAAMGVLALLGPRGLAQQWWGLGLQDTPWLLVYGNVFFNLCLLVRAGVDGFSRVSASQLAAARSLGASPWRAFWRIERPAVQPWLTSALCLVFLYCFSGFGLALILGGQRYATLEVEIYTLVAHELKLADAGVLAMLSMCITGSAALSYALLERRLATPARADAIALQPARTLAQKAALALALAALALVCAAPVLAIGARVLQAGPAAWAVVAQEQTLQALWNTLRFSTAALGVATALGLLHALAAQHSMLLRTASYLPYMVSPVAVGFGLLLLYPQWSATQLLLIIAYAMLAYPLIAKSVSTALDAMPAHLLQAARSLGASPWRCFWRVTLPIITPALRRGMAFAAATCLGEFAVSLFLSRPEWSTLTTLIYQRLARPGSANLDEALVLACLLMAVALTAFTLLEYRKDEPHA
jgi:thiamine transport system permease protein